MTAYIRFYARLLLASLAAWVLLGIGYGLYVLARWAWRLVAE